MAQDGWSVLKSYKSPSFHAISDQFAAVAFMKNDKNDKIVIAYRGTDDVTDVPADKATWTSSNAWNDQFTDALNFAWQIKQTYPDAEIYVTGHSLGGALAEVVAQMFGFDGATFDPPGAANIAASSDFADWETNTRKSDKFIQLNEHYKNQSLPDLNLNSPEGVGANFLNYVVQDSLVSGLTDDHLGYQEKLDFSATVANDKLIISAKALTASIDLLPYNLAYDWLASSGAALLQTKVLHSMEGILQYMEILKNKDIAPEFQQNATNDIQSTATGDIGSSSSSSSQSQIEFHSSKNNPYISANDLDNIIYGYAGNDAIYSLAGNDTVYASDGNDVISTAQGNDVIDAGLGNDTIYAGSGNDVISVLAHNNEIDTVSGGTGTDSLSIDFSANTSNDRTGLNWVGFNASGDLLGADGWRGANGEVHMVGGMYSVATIQDFLNNSVKLHAEVMNLDYSADLYYITSGVTFDSIENLSLIGSVYDDLLIVKGNGNYDGRGNTDTIYADWSTATQAIQIKNTLSPQTINGSTISNIERWLVQTGSGDDDISTGDSNDEIYSGAGNDTIHAGAGYDTLQGGSGNDKLFGGSGDDVYFVDDVDDTVKENKDNGYDSVNSTVSYTLSDNVEILILRGNDAIDGTGNAQDNYLYGNAARNVLDGQAGADVMYGGEGSDTYYVDNQGDVFVEYVSEGSNDRVYSTVSCYLNDNVESLYLMGSAISGTGNAQDNTLVGNSGSNWLDGGAGADTLSGGLGDDSYWVENANDLVKESADEGWDTVFSTVSYTLSDNVEGLTLVKSGNSSGFIIVGSGDVIGSDTDANNATGNAQDNILVGNVLCNILDGQAGADTMYGRESSDTYYVDNQGDIVGEDADEGNNDSVYSTVSYYLSDNVEALFLSGTADIHATGNALDNVLSGNSGANILNGGDGNDVYLFGIGGGHDLIQDSTGYDRIVLGSITPSMVSVSRVGNKIELSISADDSISFFEKAQGIYEVENIEFQNGSVWNWTDIQQKFNHAPVLAHALSDQTAKQSSTFDNTFRFSYTIPANSFTDVDVGETLTYKATLADGTSLPNWLGFNANTLTFSGLTWSANIGTLNIKLTATDSSGASASDDFKLVVEANHNPIGTPSAVLMAGAEDTPYIVSMADLLVGFSDVDSDSLTVSSLSSSGDLTANFSGWTLNNNGTFIVPILPNYNGMLYLDYDVEDGRGGSIHAVQSVNLVSVNDAPSGTDKTITFNENSTYTFTATDFGFSDVDGNSLLAVNISSLPLAGGLKLNGVAVIGNTSISIADINSGKFTYSPAVNTNGANYASFSFQVQDDGGTANGGLDLDGSANTLSFNVVAIAPMTIVGSAGSDVLIGGAANDILNGGIGADVMKGGAGNDIYYVDNAGDSVVEGNAEGVDTVYSTLVYSLADNVENLVLMENAVGISGSPVGAYGNGLNNQLTGNSADNFFIGGAGNDTLDGGVSDVYNPGVVDILVGGAGDDTFVARGFYGAGNYAGGDGSDWLDFSQPDAYTAGRRNTERAGVKVDLMVGTAATYYFNAINFTWTDASGQIALASIENIRGTAQGDSLNGNGDANVIDGGAGSDVINGGAGDDILDAGVSDIYNLGVIDLLNGGTGNDIFLSRGFYGAGKYMGGDGLDWLDFSQSDTYTDGRRNAEGAGIKVDLTAGVAFTYYQAVKNFTWVDANGKIALATIENIRGTDQGDSLSGDINANVLEGGAGNDVLNSGAGDDVLNGGIGNDVLNGGAGADDMRGGVGNDTLDGGASDVYNPSVIDTLNGDAGNDTFLVRGFYGAGNYNGGADTDLLDFSQSDTYTAGRRNAERAGVKVDLMVGTAATYYLKATNFTWTDANGQIAIASIENIRGTAQGDSLNGNGDANVIDGGAGSDVINGGAGDDILDAGVSDIYNLGVIDTLNGGAGDDSFLSRGFYGAGIYDGGTGNDTLDFSQADAYTAARRSAENAGVSVDLSTGKASTYYLSATNFTWTDANGQIAVIHIENVTGTAQGDKLIGDANANVFEGGNGSDILAGGAGKDLYLLQESVAATDTLKIATGDSLIDNYDIANSFGLGTGTANTIAVDKLDLSFTSIAANVSHVNGTDFGNVGSHSISNGLISFANVIGDTPLSITAANLTDAINYVQAAITGNNTVAFISDGNTFVFQDGGVTDTLVELVGVMANSVNNSGLGVGAVWIA